jgi:NADH dehydrogenase FAD-containing subunit
MDPQVAQVAIQRAEFGKKFQVNTKDKALIPFKYNDKDRWRL